MEAPVLPEQEWNNSPTVAGYLDKRENETLNHLNINWNHIIVYSDVYIANIILLLLL